MLVLDPVMNCSRDSLQPLSCVSSSNFLSS
jgi:hypothetical protein